ncbi:MAG: hypothetical protein IJU75_04065 [Clostridia bacterium]|nr:hypothetical protein [Clostridia bacterium]MBQ7604107.1 hypothetical protein [Clostridia bacterium]
MDKNLKKEEANVKSDVKEIDIFKLLGAFLKHIWIIVIVSVLCAAIAFAYAYFFITPTYQSSTMMYVNNGSLSVGKTSFSISDLNASKNLVDTYIVILKSRTTLEAVAERAELDMSYRTLSRMVSASAVNETEVLRVTVTDTDPERATLIANAIGEVLPLRVEKIIGGSTVEVVDSAVVPYGKAAPSLTKYAMVGFIIGLVGTLAVIVVIELLDDQVRDESFLTQNFNLPVLASIPDLNANVSGKAYKYGGKYGKYARYGKYGSRSGSYYAGAVKEETNGDK